MNFLFNAPFNSVSFGQVSTAIARELFRREAECCIYPMNGNADFNCQALQQEFVAWFGERVRAFQLSHSRDDPSIKLWHLNGGTESLSRNQHLFSFYELDDPTDTELNVAKNNNSLIFSSKYAIEAFESKGAENCKHVPLGFDADNFENTEKEYFDDDRIVFNLAGKFEHRKRHAKILRAWAKKYGDNNSYHLQCAVYNPFMSAKDNNALVSNALEGVKYSNITFLGEMDTNKEYNDYLNSANIIIGMSGGEGWGLPEFQSVALGKHAVIMDAHGYKEWANEKNSVLVKPAGKTDAYDGMFFKQGGLFSQGQIFDFDEDDFLSACEEALVRARDNKVNGEGLKLQKEFSYKKMVDSLLELL
mgnify:CR=1 FL=1